MPELTITQNTTIQQLRAFATEAGEAEIRAKKNGDGAVVLYSHSKYKLSKNSNPAERLNKQNAGREAVVDFIGKKVTSETAESLTKALMETLKGPGLKGTAVSAVAGALALARARQEVAQRSGTFDGMLATPAMRKAFVDFCADEYTSENMAFYTEVENFSKRARSADDDNKLRDARAAAKELVNLFVKEGAAQQANLPSDIRNPIVNANPPIDQMDRNQLAELFDQAQRNIFGLMKSDSFARFQKTESYKNVLSELATAAAKTV